MMTKKHTLHISWILQPSTAVGNPLALTNVFSSGKMAELNELYINGRFFSEPWLIDRG